LRGNCVSVSVIRRRGRSRLQSAQYEAANSASTYSICDKVAKDRAFQPDGLRFDAIQLSRENSSLGCRAFYSGAVELTPYSDDLSFLFNDPCDTGSREIASLQDSVLDRPPMTTFFCRGHCLSQDQGFRSFKPRICAPVSVTPTAPPLEGDRDRVHAERKCILFMKVYGSMR
jgi:hypothetical protein